MDEVAGPEDGDRGDGGGGGWCAGGDRGLSHSPAERKKRPSLCVSLNYPDLSSTVPSVGLVSLGQGAEVHGPCTSPWPWTCGALVSRMLFRTIALTEEAKRAPFLKSFFEISEAIPWPRDHILFTFTMPTTQATLAKFTKEDPHWKIRLIPD